jgi:hypothetical protein
VANDSAPSYAQAPRWPLPVVGAFALGAALALFGYAVERHHYTADVLLAVYLTPAVWLAMGG